MSREPKPGHLYTFTPGQISGMKTKQATLNDVVGHLLSGDWRNVLHFDEFRGRVVAVDPPMALDAERDRLTDADVSAIVAWLNFQGHLAGVDTVTSAVLLAARQNRFHPIRDYLDSCKLGPTPLLPNLASRVFGCEPGIADEFLRKTLIGAVRRIRRPGTKLDTTLTIVGAQGIRKSTFVAALGGEEFTRSQMPDLASRDASIALAGFWFVELAELDRIVRAETSTVKEFLTRTHDDYRAPYGRVDERHPRQVVFIGTSNEEDFLRDATGNRRFWPILANCVDVEFIRAHRDEIWAEAAALEAEGVPHWLEAEAEALAERAREAHVQEDAWHHPIREYLLGQDWVHWEDVYRKALASGIQGGLAHVGRREQMRVADTLRRLGCSQVRRNGRKGWLVPQVLAQSKPPAEQNVRGIEAYTPHMLRLPEDELGVADPTSARAS